MSKKKVNTKCNRIYVVCCNSQPTKRLYNSDIHHRRHLVPLLLHHRHHHCELCCLCNLVEEVALRAHHHHHRPAELHAEEAPVAR